MSEKRKYHNRDIPKGVLGEISKVWEEYEELLDADAQCVYLMCLCEISDILGALHSLPNIGMCECADLKNINKDMDTTLSLKLLGQYIHDVESHLGSNSQDSKFLVDDSINNAISILAHLTNIYKSRMDFRDIILFMYKTKNACNEN